MDTRKETQAERIEYLEAQLQQQKGMWWLFEEIMKETADITSFEKGIEILTDMLMGVMGVTTCYVWVRREQVKVENYKVYFRSIELKNEFRKIEHVTMAAPLMGIDEPRLFVKEEISVPLIDCVTVPGSRLAIPLSDFKGEEIFGTLVLEQEEEAFFTPTMVCFFKTLAVFISVNILNSKLVQNISDDSVTDPLTGSYNRRHLDHVLKQMGKGNDIMTVAVIDVDNFKTINDELGHLQGDMVLRAITHLAKGCVKEYGGEVVRYGGDEFVMLIPKVMSEAVHILEEFKKNIDYIPITYGIAMNITVTLGVCSYPEMAPTPNLAVKIADDALCKGKVIGKNRIVLATNENVGVCNGH